MTDLKLFKCDDGATLDLKALREAAETYPDGAHMLVRKEAILALLSRLEAAEAALREAGCAGWFKAHATAIRLARQVPGPAPERADEGA